MTPFIGIGPGRCGTSSLARIIGSCEGTRVTHEAYPSEWYTAGCNIGKLITDMRNPGNTLVGEVSCNLIPHVQTLRNTIRDLKVVCLHRHMDEVVDSFMAFRPSLFRPGDRENRKRVLEAGGIDPCKILEWPVIDAATERQSWEFYWHLVEESMKLVEPPVHHMQMRSLNDDFSLKHLYDFLGIALTSRSFPAIRVHNSLKERIRA